jgi:hypothetical protein
MPRSLISRGLFQALEGAGAISWDRGAAMNLILSSQAPDGSFGDTFTTTEVVLALQPRGLAQASQCKCNKPRLPPSDTELGADKTYTLPILIPNINTFVSNTETLTPETEVSLLNIAKGPIIENLTSHNK